MDLKDIICSRIKTMGFCLIAAQLLSIANVHLNALSNAQNLEKRTLKWQCRQFIITNDYSDCKTLTVSIKRPGLALLPFQWPRHGYSAYTPLNLFLIPILRKTLLSLPFSIRKSADGWSKVPIQTQQEYLPVPPPKSRALTVPPPRGCRGSRASAGRLLRSVPLAASPARPAGSPAPHPGSRAVPALPRCSEPRPPLHRHKRSNSHRLQARRGL